MVDPKRKALMKPFELIGISAVFGAFVGFIVVYTMGLANLLMGIIAGGGTFIVAIVVLAMLVLSYRPNANATHYLDRFDTETGDEDTDAIEHETLDAARPADSEGVGARAVDDVTTTPTVNEPANEPQNDSGDGPVGDDGAAAASSDVAAQPTAVHGDHDHADALDEAEIIDVIEVDDTESGASGSGHDEHPDRSEADPDRR